MFKTALQGNWRKRRCQPYTAMRVSVLTGRIHGPSPMIMKAHQGVMNLACTRSI